VIDAGEAVSVLAVPEVASERPPMTPALMIVGASLLASWPVAATVKSWAMPYGAKAISSVPESPVGNVQCGSIVGTAVQGKRRVAGTRVLNVVSIPSWKARSLADPTMGVSGMKCLLASKGCLSDRHPRSVRTVKV
jgi:hypothetical protein